MSDIIFSVIIKVLEIYGQPTQLSIRVFGGFDNRQPMGLYRSVLGRNT